MQPCAISVVATLCVTAASSVAAAENRSLGAEPATKCAALSGEASGAMHVDTAVMVDAKPLTVADGGPTPASRIGPATPQFSCLAISTPPIRRHRRSASS